MGVLGMLNVFRSSDRVDVVRCGDCRWFERDEGKAGEGFCPMVVSEVAEDFFCAWGKKSDGAE